MAKCTECRQIEALDRWYEKLASWFVWHLFPKTVRDERNAGHLMGFEDGYKIGRKWSQNITYEEVIKSISKEDMFKVVPR